MLPKFAEALPPIMMYMAEADGGELRLMDAFAHAMEPLLLYEPRGALVPAGLYSELPLRELFAIHVPNQIDTDKPPLPPGITHLDDASLMKSPYKVRTGGFHRSV